MITLEAMKGLRLLAFKKRDFDWLIVFDNEISIQIGCLWRLLRKGKIAVTGEDHGQRFGHDIAVDAEKSVTDAIGNSSILDVTIDNETLDVDLILSNEFVFQILPNSSGYEAWSLNSHLGNVIAIGGGELAVTAS